MNINHSLHGAMTSHIHSYMIMKYIYIYEKMQQKNDTLQKLTHIATQWRKHIDLIFNHGKNSLIKSHQIMLSNSFSEGISKVVFASNIFEIKNKFIK